MQSEKKRKFNYKLQISSTIFEIVRFGECLIRILCFKVILNGSPHRCIAEVKMHWRNFSFHLIHESAIRSYGGQCNCISQTDFVASNANTERARKKSDDRTMWLLQMIMLWGPVTTCQHGRLQSKMEIRQRIKVCSNVSRSCTQIVNYHCIWRVSHQQNFIFTPTTDTFG